MFGIANQLLAVIALSVITVWIVNQGRARYAPVTLLPLAFVTSTTMTAGVQLVLRFHKNAEDAAKVRASTTILNLNLVLVLVMLACVLVVLGDCGRACSRRLKA